MPKDSLAPSDKRSTALPLLTLEQLALALEAQDISVRIVGDPSRVVSGMAIDSRMVEPGNLFVCKGAAFRPAFLGGAIEDGAAAYMCEGVGAELGVPSELLAVSPLTPALVVSDVRRAMRSWRLPCMGTPRRGCISWALRAPRENPRWRIC